MNKDHTSDRIEADGLYANVLEDLHNSKELESSQVYDDIDKHVKNKFIHPNAAKPEVKDDMMQIYSIVDMHANKGKIKIQEKMNDLKCMEISDIYAVVDRSAKNKSQEESIVGEYAVVDKSAKKRRQEQKNVTDEYAVVDKSTKKKLSKNSMVDKNTINTVSTTFT